MTIFIGAHIVVGTRFICDWFFKDALRSFQEYYRIPAEARIFKIPPWEYEYIAHIRQVVPEDENLLFVPVVNEMVNYYVYPRRVYRFKPEESAGTLRIDMDFINKRKIKYVFFTSSGSLQRIESGPSPAGVRAEGGG